MYAIPLARNRPQTGTLFTTCASSIFVFVIYRETVRISKNTVKLIFGHAAQHYTCANAHTATAHPHHQPPTHILYLADTYIQTDLQ